MKKRDSVKRAGNNSKANLVSNLVYDIHVNGMTVDQACRKYKVDESKVRAWVF